MDSVDSTRAKSLDSAPPSARIEYSGSTPTSTTTGYHQVPPESSVGEYAARYATEQYGTIARLAHFGFNFGLFFGRFYLIFYCLLVFGRVEHWIFKKLVLLAKEITSSILKISKSAKSSALAILQLFSWARTMDLRLQSKS